MFNLNCLSSSVKKNPFISPRQKPSLIVNNLDALMKIYLSPMLNLNEALVLVYANLNDHESNTNLTLGIRQDLSSSYSNQAFWPDSNFSINIKLPIAKTVTKIKEKILELNNNDDFSSTNIQFDFSDVDNFLSNYFEQSELKGFMASDCPIDEVLKTVKCQVLCGRVDLALRELEKMQVLLLSKEARRTDSEGGINFFNEYKNSIGNFYLTYGDLDNDLTKKSECYDCYCKLYCYSFNSLKVIVYRYFEQGNIFLEQKDYTNAIFCYEKIEKIIENSNHTNPFFTDNQVNEYNAKFTRAKKINKNSQVFLTPNLASCSLTRVFDSKPPTINLYSVPPLVEKIKLAKINFNRFLPYPEDAPSLLEIFNNILDKSYGLQSLSTPKDISLCIRDNSRAFNGDKLNVSTNPQDWLSEKQFIQLEKAKDSPRYQALFELFNPKKLDNEIPGTQQTYANHYITIIRQLHDLLQIELQDRIIDNETGKLNPIIGQAIKKCLELQIIN